jgi:hypothetical protein
LPNCIICSATTTCTSCINSSYAISNFLCKTCISLITGCSTCSNSTTCLTCDPNLNFTSIPNSGICECTNGYGLDINNKCILCSEIIPGCTLCNPVTTCTACGSSTNYTTLIPVNNLCSCDTHYALNNTNFCILCS